jgi:hypothetical protein
MSRSLKGRSALVTGSSQGLGRAIAAEALAAGPERVGEELYRDLLRQKEAGGTSLGRAAALAAFLASPHSDGITGKLISAVWDPWEGLGVHREELRGSDIYTLRRIVPGDRGKSWGDP